MTSSKITRSDWYPEKSLLVTHISGDVDKVDVEAWERSLQDALAQIEDHSTFKIFVNLYGFKAVNLEAHKRFRDIVPLTLSRFGWKVGYVDLFEEAAQMTVSNTRGIQCRGAAHAHQDATKIDEYEKRFGHSTERFFTDPIEAEEWIQTIP